MSLHCIRIRTFPYQLHPPPFFCVVHDGREQTSGRLGKQYGSGLPSLLASLKGLRRAGNALSERHFFCYVVRGLIYHLSCNMWGFVISS